SRLRRPRNCEKTGGVGRDGEPLAPLHFVPQRVQLLEARPPHVHSALLGEPFDPLEAPLELVVRFLERGAGIDRQLASQVYYREEKVTDFAFDYRERGAGSGSL